MGVAPVERFDGAPPAHHPAELLPGAKAVMTFGIRILDRVMEWPDLLKGSPFYPESKRAEALRLCLYEKSGYQIINDHLNTIALRLATHLEESGYPLALLPHHQHRRVRRSMPTCRPCSPTATPRCGRAWGVRSEQRGRHGQVRPPAFAGTPSSPRPR